MPALPLPATDEIKLSDWLEVYALVSPGGNSSFGDLERALGRAGVLESSDRGAMERKLADVSYEMQSRQRSASHGYPFAIRGGLVTLRGAREDFAAYVFCLCLSFLRVWQRRGSQVFPRRMFEELSCVAARNYLGGEGVKFGAPRAGLPRQFKFAINTLCTLMGEGEQCRVGRVFSAKDDTLDVVAWKHFPDRLAGKLVLFGQCASGADWESKMSELQPESFCQNWLYEQPPSRPIRAFFIPHRIRPDRWNSFTRKAGIVFDRCRLAYWSQGFPGLARREFVRWANSVLRDVR